MVMLNLTYPILTTALALLAARFEALRQEKRIPGMSAAIIYDDQLIWSNGFGYADIEKKIPASPKTVYHIGSITKSFTATMLMQLRDAGKLQLDDAIEKYLPEFKIKSKFSDSRPITFRQIASHMAGLPCEAPLDYWKTMKGPPIKAILESLKNTELIFPPMAKFKYSNLGYAILGHALEIIANQPYEEYIVEHILQPLAMDSSGFFDPNKEGNYNLKHHMATGYIGYQNNRPPKTAPYFDAGGFAPASQLSSSVEDNARFVSLQFKDDGNGAGSPSSAKGGGETNISENILSSSSLREMHTITSIRNNWEEGYALGWLVKPIAGHITIGHTGDLPGFSTGIALVPDIKLGISIFINKSGWPPGIIHSSFELLIPIVSRMLQQIVEKEREEKPIPASWKKYIGYYKDAHDLFGAEVKVVNRKLVLRELEPGEEEDEEEQPSQRQLILLIPDKEAKQQQKFRMDGGSADGEALTFEIDSVTQNATAIVVGVEGSRLERTSLALGQQNT